MESFTTVGMSREQIRDVYNRVLLNLYTLYNRCITEHPFTAVIEIEIKELEKTKKALKKMLGD